ncbi:MAG: hypothetical protein AAGA54_29010 [Myxococcota bacterium]
MASIQMDIVGIYLSVVREIDLGDSDKGLSVREVMDQFREQLGGSDKVGGFDYMTVSASNPMFAMRHRYAGGQTRSKKQRLAGLYDLREQSLSNGQIGLGWQYYVIDENGQRLSATPPGEGFTSFLDARFPWGDKWKLIWRLVAIRREPLS